jgi:predicted dehydrogenase
VEEVYSYDEIEGLSPDVAFITNPTSHHVETAARSASMGMHLFIEKPLGHRLDDWNSLLETVRKKDVHTYVACNLRFDPILRHLKRALDLTQVFYARVNCSSYLPGWRPSVDYRETYSSKKALGGGVILDLVHEPDYCHWLFGKIRKIKGEAGKCSTLEIETEDFADMTLYHESGFISNLHLDYFGHRPKRKIEIFGEDLYMEADLMGRTVRRVTGKMTDERQFGSLDRDYTYQQELRYFFRCLNEHQRPMNDIEEHITVLKPLLAFKETLGL